VVKLLQDTADDTVQRRGGAREIPAFDMPGSAHRRCDTSVCSLFALLAVVVLLLVTATSVVASEVGQNIPAQKHPTNKALSFSRRGLENANRLSKSQGLQDGSEAGLVEDLRPASTRDLVLSDIVLVSSVEGGIYGLERSSGKTLWTLAARIRRDSKAGSTSNLDEQLNTTTYGGASPAGFSPLIGTSYGPDRRSFSDLANNLPLLNSSIIDATTGTKSEVATGHEALEALQELGLYVVEPSAGQVYVLTTSSDSHGSPGSPKTSLSKLPLTLPQLVDLSPFSFPGDNSRVFVGHKSTSLVEIDIQSGRIGAVFGGGQDAGVWCDSPLGEKKPDEECGHDQNDSGEWAYVGLFRKYFFQQAPFLLTFENAESHQTTPSLSTCEADQRCLRHSGSAPLHPTQLIVTSPPCGSKEECRLTTASSWVCPTKAR
jgi:hypothetical protein